MAVARKEVSTRRKLALLIANGNYYRPENRLTETFTTVMELHDALRTMGFNVTMALNGTKEEMIIKVNELTKKIVDGDLIFMYFSGHGYAVHGKNYLIPIDDERIESLRDVEDFSFDIEPAISRVAKRNPSYASIFVLDCCRSYVLKRGLGVIPISHSTGLQEMIAPQGTLIQFSCAANQASNDDCFAKHFLENITQEYVEINIILQDISNTVYHNNNNQRRPWSMNNLQSDRHVYFNGIELLTENFFSQKPLSVEEKDYYEECKDYYRLTNEPIVSIAEEIWDNSTEIVSSSLKIGIDIDYNKLDLNKFLNEFCAGVGLLLNDIAVKQIQAGSAILQADIFNNVKADEKKLRLRIVGQRLTAKISEQLATMNIFFMYMGPIESCSKMQKHREEIRFNPQYNRIYYFGHHYWRGAINDGIDRGGKAYFCPVGWQRWSLYVTDHFDEKFNGWCIAYHGTKFAHGLSILLSGLKPAINDAHGPGIYVTPSIIYAAHPRYSEVRLIDERHRRFFKAGKYVQFVLECRVHPDNIIKIGEETLGVKNCSIDSNVDNAEIEWCINAHGKTIVDFNDPEASIVCTGILKRVTSDHPGLLPQSAWWYQSHLCNRSECCKPGMAKELLLQRKERGYSCQILFNQESN